MKAQQLLPTAFLNLDFGPMNEFDIEAFVFYEVSRVSLYCAVYAYDSSFSKDYFNPLNDKGKISLEYRHLCKNLL